MLASCRATRSEKKSTRRSFVCELWRATGLARHVHYPCVERDDRYYQGLVWQRPVHWICWIILALPGDQKPVIVMRLRICGHGKCCNRSAAYGLHFYLTPRSGGQEVDQSLIVLDFLTRHRNSMDVNSLRSACIRRSSRLPTRSYSVHEGNIPAWRKLFHPQCGAGSWRAGELGCRLRRNLEANTAHIARPPP